MLRERIARLIYTGWFSRTIPQAEFLDRILSELNISLDYVLNIHAEDLEKTFGRRVCLNVESYHITYNPPYGKIYDECGSKLIRDDDKAINRLKISPADKFNDIIK